MILVLYKNSKFCIFSQKYKKVLFLRFFLFLQLCANILTKFLPALIYVKLFLCNYPWSKKCLMVNLLVLFLLLNCRKSLRDFVLFYVLSNSRGLQTTVLFDQRIGAVLYPSILPVRFLFHCVCACVFSFIDNWNNVERFIRCKIQRRKNSKRFVYKWMLLKRLKE